MTPHLRGRKRILVIGSGGAGKSTFARALGAELGLPVIHLDRHFWQPGWQPTARAEWDARVAELAAASEWVMDGNYGASLAIRLRRCDAVVFFDFSRLVCLWGVVKRRIATGSAARPDMAEGCQERLSPEFLRWIWQYPSVSRPRIVAALAAADRNVQVVAVTRRREAADLLRACRAASPIMTAPTAP